MERARGKRSVLAIDLGKARAGVAISDELGLMAHARPFLDAHSRKALIASIAEIARSDAVERILVGHPLEMTGEEGPAANRARAFAEEVAAATGLTVELVDERLTTVEAKRRLDEGGKRARDRRAAIDGASAAVLLQAWLDRR